jgi:hypothetical protein
MKTFQFNKSVLTKLIFVLVTGLAFSYCAPQTPLAFYPDFSTQKEAIESVTLFGDIVVLRDIKGNQDLVSLVENRELWKLFKDVFREELQRKGYNIERSLLTSMGLLMEETRRMKVERTLEDRELKIQDLTVANPPFFIDEQFKSNPELMDKLEALYGVLDKFRKYRGDANMIIDEATSLQQGIKGEALFIVFIAGRNVPLTKQIGQALISSIATLGTFYIYDTSGLFYNLYVITPHNGELIWADYNYMKGGNVNAKSVRTEARTFARKIPPRLGIYNNEPPVEEISPDQE